MKGSTEKMTHAHLRLPACVHKRRVSARFLQVRIAELGWIIGLVHVFIVV